MVKISAIEFSVDKYSEIPLNNLQKQLIVKEKQHLSSTEYSITSKNNFVNEYKTNLKDQIESPKFEIILLRRELRESNVPTKCKCIASIADDMEFHNNNKDNNNHNRNENNSNKNIVEKLDNNPISN